MRIKLPFSTDVALRYLLVGLLNTSLCLSMMYVGAKMGWGYLTYTLFGSFFSVIFSFFMNLKFTFRVQGQIVRRMVLFALVNGFNLLLIESIEYILIEQVHFGHLISILFALGCATVVSFLINNFIVYRVA